jgi:hypothetical protein
VLHLSKKAFPKVTTVEDSLPSVFIKPPSTTPLTHSCKGSAKIHLVFNVPQKKNGCKVLYWAAKKPRNGHVVSQKEAYGDYSNRGVGRVKNGQLSVCVDQPQVYSVKGTIYAPHLHFCFSLKNKDKWDSKVFSLYVPRRACGVKGLITYDKHKSYSLATPLLLTGSTAHQKKMAKRLASKSMYNVFFSH